MPILLNSTERHQLSPNLLNQASSLKHHLSSPRPRTKIFNSLSPRLHSPAKQLQTNLIKIRISKFIGGVQQRQERGQYLAPPQRTSLGALNQRFNSPALFSLSPKIEALEELDSLSAGLLSANLLVSTKRNEPDINVRSLSLNSQAKTFVPSQKKTQKYVPPHKRKRSGVRPSNVDWRTGNVMAKPIKQPALRLVPWFHTLSALQKEEHNRQCAQLRILRKLQKQARNEQRA